MQRLRSLREQIEQTKVEIEKAERQYDLNKVAELKYGKLAQLENQEVRAQLSPAVSAPDRPVQNDLFASGPSPVERRLAGIDPDQLTPREALDLVYALKKLV